MEELNHTVFEYINAGEHTADLAVSVGKFTAIDLIYGVPLLLVIGWLVGSDSLRKILFEAFCAIGLALGISTIIGLLWPQPRPYMIELGQTLIDYEPKPSFPSDHATIVFTLGASLLLHESTRRLGVIVAAAGVAVAWGRVFIGVHFPLDMAGAVVLAIIAAGATAWLRPRVVTPVYERVVRPLFRFVFGPVIRRGWIRE